MRVADVRVSALELVVAVPDVVGVWTRSSGERVHFTVGTVDELIPRIDALRGELRDPMSISTGRTPRLREFIASWGCRFLPPGLAEDMPDVLVIVPHGATHDLPLHLVRVAAPTGDRESPLGVMAGVTYASSRSLFLRTVDRNPARQYDLKAWRCDEVDAPEGQPPPRSIMASGVDVLGSLDEEFRALCQSVIEGFDGQRVLFLDPDFPRGRDSIKAAFRREPAPAVVCVMAHGWIDDDNHRMSGLLVERNVWGLALRPIPLHGGRYFDFRDLPLRRVPHQLSTVKETEVFTAAELEVDVETSCELVMLLGCSAGWGRVLQGDEPASLAETWLKIGAASAVAPMWDAPIDAVRLWAEAFVEGWTRQGMPKALAMRHAMRRMYGGACRDNPERLGVMTLRGDWL